VRHAAFLEQLDGRLTRASAALERLSGELAAVEQRLNGHAIRPVPAEVQKPAENGHVLFVSSAAGYALLFWPGPAPELGAELELPDLGGFLVSKLGPAPLPGDGRRCAYLLGS